MRKYIYGLLIFLLAFVLVIALNLFFFSRAARVISTGEPIEMKGTGKTALLVIDIQEGTTGIKSIDQCYIDQADELIATVNQLTAEAQEEGIEIIYIGSDVVNPLINLINSTLARGSVGAGFDKRLEIRNDQIVMKRKGDAFHEEELDEMLTGLGVEKLVLTGLDAAHCVTYTAKGALNRGYQVAVIENAIIAEDEAMKQEALEGFRELGVEIK